MSFRIKIIALILLVSIVPYAFLMSYFGNTLRQRYYDNTLHEMQTQLSLNVEQIQQYLENIKRDMQFIGALDVMNDIYSLDVDRRISNLLEQKKVELELLGDFYVVDKNDSIIASSNSEKIFQKIDKEPFYSVDIISNINNEKIALLELEFSLKNFTKFFDNNDGQIYYIVDDGKPLFKSSSFEHFIVVRKALAFDDKIEIVLEKNQEDFLNELAHYEKLFILALLLGAIIIGWSAFILINKLIRPILELSHNVEEITKTKDYSKNIEVQGKDEIAKLAQAFKQMLSGIVKALKENELLNKEIEETQKEVVFTMGAIGESRSKETGNHVKRVAEYSKLLALFYGLSEDEAEMLKQASPMHDIGKIAIPDAVLNKPGRFNDDERKIMDTHAQIGYEMLKASNRPLLLAAATVAYEHHEKWDGTGYPRKLAGEEIHIYGRITALADVFDALGSDRVYKKAWDDERIFNLFKEQRAQHFDPKLVDLFFENLDQFLKIRDTFKDT